jgi:hypothetical protein
MCNFVAHGEAPARFVVLAIHANTAFPLHLKRVALLIGLKVVVDTNGRADLVGVRLDRHRQRRWRNLVDEVTRS